LEATINDLFRTRTSKRIQREFKENSKRIQREFKENSKRTKAKYSIKQLNTCILEIKKNKRFTREIKRDLQEFYKTKTTGLQ